MARRFGQNAFAAVSGVVTAAGMAVCLVSAQGQIEVRKHATGATASVAAQIQGTQYRTRKIPVLVAQAQATASGNAKADWLVAGTAYAPATAYGRGTAEFFGSGEANAVFTFDASPYRIARTRGMVARGGAQAQAEAYLYQVLYGVPAKVSASLYGTTYHLAYGVAPGTASASGRITWHAGIKAEAFAGAAAEAAAHYTVTLWPIEAVGEATAYGEDAVTIGGVRYQEAYGRAVAEGLAENTHIAIYPSVTAWVSANLQGQAAYIVGAKGEAQGKATLSGTMIAASTAVTLVQGDSLAQATGRLRAFHKFKGTAEVQASGNGVPLVTETGVNGHGQVSATGVGTVQVRNTKVYPDTGYGVALLKGVMNRVKSLAGVSASAYSSVMVKVRRIHIGYGVAKGNGYLSGTQFRTRLFGGVAKAAAKAQILNLERIFVVRPAVGTAQAFGQIKRDHFISGIAVGSATSDVRVQVNDAVQAPVGRTVLVLNEPRLALATPESRTLVV